LQDIAHFTSLIKSRIFTPKSGDEYLSFLKLHN